MKDKFLKYVQKKVEMNEFLILHGIFYVIMTLLTLYGVFLFEPNQTMINVVTWIITILAFLFIFLNLVMLYKMRYNNLKEIAYLFIVVIVPLLLILYIRL